MVPKKKKIFLRAIHCTSTGYSGKRAQQLFVAGSAPQQPSSE